MEAMEALDDKLRFHGVQLADDYTEYPSGYLSLISEPKFDGYRLASVIVDGEVTFYCRDNKPVVWGANLDHIRDELLELGFDDCMVDGEVMAEDWNRTGIIKRGCGSKGYKRPGEQEMAEIRAEVKYHVFDWVDLSKVRHVEGERKKMVPCFGMPLYERLQVLDLHLRGAEMTDIIRRVAQTKVIDEADLQAAFDAALLAGYEGIVLKVPASVYTFTRSKAWRKYKPVETVELEVLEIVEGKGKLAGRMGTMKCRNAANEIIFCGTGVDHAQCAVIFAEPEKYLNRIFEAEVTKSAVAIARHPRFKRWRDDRTSL